jgi:hypothetical protein
MKKRINFLLISILLTSFFKFLYDKKLPEVVEVPTHCSGKVTIGFPEDVKGRRSFQAIKLYLMMH